MRGEANKISISICSRSWCFCIFWGTLNSEGIFIFVFIVLSRHVKYKNLIMSYTHQLGILFKKLFGQVWSKRSNSTSCNSLAMNWSHDEYSRQHKVYEELCLLNREYKILTDWLKCISKYWSIQRNQPKVWHKNLKLKDRFKSHWLQDSCSQISETQ